jgi:3-phosphoshikimate 1-carboxyvinyltransferase
MTAARAQPARRPVRGVASVPGDKSISHRAALIAAVAEGSSLVRGFSPAGDCASTLKVLRALGVVVRRHGDAVTVTGREEFPVHRTPLNCGRSGTTMRLLAGILAGRQGRFELTGHEQLLRRPIERVAAPLRSMGATVRTGPDGRPPLTIEGGSLSGIDYVLPVPSAQVKSALLLAGLRADGETAVTEPVPTRDHTERLLAATGIGLHRSPPSPSGHRITVHPGVPASFDLLVPGDPSSAAARIAAAALVPGSDLLLRGVGLNPTRTGFLEVLERMGNPVSVENLSGGTEPGGDLRIRHGLLQGVRIQGQEVPGVIDELPLIGLLATQADGVTEVRGAGELRVKESDRIAGLVAGLRALGAEAEELPDGFVVRGPTRLTGGRCDATTDHRLAMTFSLAGLVATGPVAVDGLEYVDDSFPGFVRILKALR